MRKRRSFWVALGFWLGTACGGPATPATDVSAGDVPDVVAAASKKYDILWVIDHSSSMAQHQRALVKALPQFIATLKGKGNVDVQTAVVTVQQIADSASATGANRPAYASRTASVSALMRFVHEAAAHTTRSSASARSAAASAPARRERAPRYAAPASAASPITCTSRSA